MNQICLLYETTAIARHVRAAWFRWPSETGLSFKMRSLGCHPGHSQLQILLAGHAVKVGNSMFKLEWFEVSET